MYHFLPPRHRQDQIFQTNTVGKKKEAKMKTNAGPKNINSKQFKGRNVVVVIINIIIIIIFNTIVII